VRLGGWRWSAENPNPPWAILQKAHLWSSERGKWFESTFCKPKHTITAIPASDSNQAAFNIKKDTNETIQVALYNGKLDTIAETIESSKVRAAFWHVVITRNQPLKVPEHLPVLLDQGTPVMMWGRKASLERALNTLKTNFPQKTYLPMALYWRPPSPILGSKFRTTEFASGILCDEATVQGQVYPYSVPFLSPM
jgi:hypothetical protein